MRSTFVNEMEASLNEVWDGWCCDFSNQSLVFVNQDVYLCQRDNRQLPKFDGMWFLLQLLQSQFILSCMCNLLPPLLE